jgi:hypothetical protein
MGLLQVVHKMNVQYGRNTCLSDRMFHPDCTRMVSIISEDLHQLSPKCVPRSAEVPLEHFQNSKFYYSALAFTNNLVIYSDPVRSLHHVSALLACWAVWELSRVTEDGDGGVNLRGLFSCFLVSLSQYSEGCNGLSWFETQGNLFEIWNKAGLLDSAVRGRSAPPLSFLVV